MCGCFAALLRLLGTGIWSYSSLLPHEVLGAVEQRVRGCEGAAGEGAGQAGLRLPPNEAVQKKALEILPLLVSSSAGVQSCAISTGGGRDDGEEVIWRGNQGPSTRGDWLTRPGVGGGTQGGIEDPGEASLADAVLELISTELADCRGMVPSMRQQGGLSLQNRGSAIRRRMVLTQALLGVLEVCYGRVVQSASDNGDGDDNNVARTTTAEGRGNATGCSRRLSEPESWPWNHDSNTFGNSMGRGPRQRRHLASWQWPLSSAKSWGPRLADAAGDRAGYEGGSSVVVERAAIVVELVLRRHAGAAWGEALFALRVASSGGPARQADASGAGLEAAVGLLPLCEPLLKRICLELPVLDLPARVHSAVFEAHAWLALLPCGNVLDRKIEIREREGG